MASVERTLSERVSSLDLPPAGLSETCRNVGSSDRGGDVAVLDLSFGGSGRCGIDVGGVKQREDERGIVCDEVDRRQHVVIISIEGAAGLDSTGGCCCFVLKVASS